MATKEQNIDESVDFWAEFSDLGEEEGENSLSIPDIYNDDDPEPLIPGIGEEEEEEEAEVKKAEEAKKEAEEKKEEEKSEEEEDLDEVLGTIGEDDNIDSPKDDNHDEGVISNDVVSKLVEEGILFDFEDEDKPEGDYTEKDIIDLLKANIEEAKKTGQEKAKEEWESGLSEELKYAAEYERNGGKDQKALFSLLSRANDIKSLSPENENDVPIIARQYLATTQFGTPEEIEAQLEEWNEAGLLGKKAAQFKPKLDNIEKQRLDSVIASQQEQIEKNRLIRESYIDDVYNAFKDGKVGDVKINKEMQRFLFSELTEAKYVSPINGSKVTGIGKAMQELQFGENKNLALVGEALWLLTNPEEYKKAISKSALSKNEEEHIRKIKTNQGKSFAEGKSSESIKDKENKSKGRKTVKRTSVPNIYD